jgi:hypothetical protein
MRFRSRTVFLILLAASVASVFSTAIAYQSIRNMGGSPETFTLAALNTSFWFGWAVLAVPLTALSARWRLDRTPIKAVPILVAAALCAGALHVCLQTTTQAAIWVRTMALKEPVTDYLGMFGRRWVSALPGQLLQLIDWELLAGMGVIALAHAVFYYRETQARALREANLETRLMEAHLTALQQQLQPHFLFNTLHAISALMHRDVDLADKVLVRLSDLLRITLESGGEKEVRLSRELDFIRSYLEIEQTRIGDRLTLQLDIDPNTLDCVVPMLILQPLVENAVKHGVAPHAGPAHIVIRSLQRDNMLHLSVANNGPVLGVADPERSSGIGLVNTRARLLHHYGDSGWLDLKKRTDGFTAELTFPCRI